MELKNFPDRPLIRPSMPVTGFTVLNSVVMDAVKSPEDGEECAGQAKPGQNSRAQRRRWLRGSSVK